MKKYLLILVLLVSTFGFSQSSHNWFSNDNETSQSYNDQMYQQDADPGAPGDPVPIDGMVPLLIIAGISIIFYVNYRRKLEL